MKPQPNPPTHFPGKEGGFDAIVIGAGPAGSVTARELARRGCKVLLLDKATFPRTKVCGCCLNGAAIGTLERLGLGHVLDGAIALDRVTVTTGSRTADLRLPRGAALSREVFDARLIDAAIEAGVEFRPGTAATLSKTHSAAQGRFVATANNSPGFAKLVVLATGLASPGTEPERGSRLGAGVVIPEADAPEHYSAGTIHMATARAGYVGLVRVEDGRLDVAAAFDAGFVKSLGGLGSAAEAILREVGWPVPSGLAKQPWKGTPELTRRPAKLAQRRLFVVGDAAGYVEPFTGEGMAWAVMSAAALAPIAARAVRNWDDGLIRQWEAAHRRVAGRRQRVCRVVARVLRSPALMSLTVRALRSFPFLARPVVGSLNRPTSIPHGLPV